MGHLYIKASVNAHARPAVNPVIRLFFLPIYRDWGLAWMAVGQTDGRGCGRKEGRTEAEGKSVSQSIVQLGNRDRSAHKRLLKSPCVRICTDTPIINDGDSYSMNRARPTSFSFSSWQLCHSNTMAAARKSGLKQTGRRAGTYFRLD